MHGGRGVHVLDERGVEGFLRSEQSGQRAAEGKRETLFPGERVVNGSGDPPPLVEPLDERELNGRHRQPWLSRWVAASRR